jgi:3-hydroxyacyl-CoA dehydrogenase/enoyl-CoA hydratase/3-hydroxybutyryl-CoA epimerase
MSSNLTITTDADGIMTLSIDVKDRPMNVLTPGLLSELDAAIDSARANPAVKGLLITSGKSSFVAGADIKDMVNTHDRPDALAYAMKASQVLTGLYRKLETCGKPVAAAINGLALGGGLELCLACHYRVLSNDPKATVGLPEVTIGLLPGAGGTQRLPRLIGINAAVPILTQGKPLKPEEALKLGVVHALAAPSEVVASARRWLLGSPEAVQPWDKKGFKIPGGGAMSPATAQTFMVGTALAAKLTQRNYPAPVAILSCVFEGTQVPIDQGLKIESQQFAKLLSGPVARNLMRTMFINKGLADKLSRRPAEVPKSQVRKLGILGAGMMGSGIAYSSALAGIEVVLLDSTQAQADKGKSYSANLIAKDVEKGRTTREKGDALLARIQPTTDYAALANCDLIVEAVFEQRDIKADVTRKAEAVIPKSAVFASNTSTLPITGLATASQRPKQFIGIHFFSPVEKMPLVEIIVGKKTSQETIAKALDYVAQLRKTPIVVNDSRGFYTSRVFGTYCAEGMKMLEEGVNPALIENVARQAGMPVGPLAVSDEVTLELQYKVLKQSEADLGEKYVKPVYYDVLHKFVEDLKRIGRRGGGGFYEYPADGRKFLWPGLAQVYPRAAQQPEAEEVRKRLLYIQALETARCLEEGVLTHPADGDLGSILGFGFPAYTGGTLSFIDTLGIAAFVEECNRLAKRHGPRFKPSRWLIARAREGRPFHDTEAPTAA